VSASSSLDGGADSDYSAYFTRLLVTNNSNDFLNHSDTLPLLLELLQQTLQQEQLDMREANNELLESVVLLISHLSDHSMCHV
jgi:hypothetical protein